MGVLADLIALVNGNTEKTLDVLIQEKATETNSNIASVDAKVQAGNNLVGANNNTGGSVGVGSLSARINKLLTDWTTTRAGYLDTINLNVGTLLNGRVVKSVQRGLVRYIPGNNTYTANISPIDLNKSVSIVSPQARPNETTFTAPAVSGGRLLSSNQIEVWIQPNTNGHAFDITWQVIEFY